MNQKVYFPHLDGLRFLAFFYVFMYHCYFAVPEIGKDNPFYLVFHKLWENGDLGVNFFFTLSGFLITYLILVEEKVNGSFSIKSFYWRRTLRIWPLYFATLVFGYFIFQLLLDLVNAGIEEHANIWYYVFFLGNFNSIINGDPLSGTLSVLWSLAIEEQFYLFWPILLLIFKRSRLALFILLLLISLVFRGINFQNHTLIFYHTFSVMSDLVIGAWLAWWSFTKSLKQEESDSLSKKYSVLIYLLGLTLILFRKELFVAPILVMLERLIFSLFFAFIIFDQTFAKTSLLKIGSFEKISFWGKFTYGLYCLHIPAMVFTEGFAMMGEIHESAWWVFYGKTISTFLLSLIFCRLSFRYLERPFLRLKEALPTQFLRQRVN
jgi:peptidoglycan/LPS O-acetylase OafA/YrhL